MLIRRKNYRIIAFIMTLACLFTFVFTPTLTNTNAIENAPVFIDVPESHWAYTYVNNLSELGIVKGLGDGNFGVDLTATRAEFATFMIRALKITPSDTYENIFNDVIKEKWYALNVEAAYNAEIVKGKGNGIFDPDAIITRQEVTTVIANAVAINENSTIELLAESYELPNSDANIVSEWAVDGLKICYKYSLINGYVDGSFKPEASITRAEVAVVISKFNDYLNNQPTLTPIPTPTRVPAFTPELPRVLLDTTYSEPTGKIITVNDGDDLQAAINSANPGDTIELQAGAIFYGNFVLPYKEGDDWIIIRSSEYAKLPEPGSRVSPADAVNMSMIVTPNNTSAIRTDLNAHHYRLIGLEISNYDGTTENECYDLISLGSGDSTQSSLDVVAHDLILDRCYMHGYTEKNLKRAVALNSARTSIIDSYISDCHTNYPDNQGICGWNGPGPYKIVNNYIEGGSENIMFGGADTTIPNMTPSDIEVRGNYLFKPLSWKADDPSFGGIAWNVKNLFELKHANRVLVEGNVMQNNWVGADQLGYAIVLTPRNDVTNPWCSVKDVLIKNNIIKNSNRAVMVMGVNPGIVCGLSERIEVSNNVFDNITVQANGQAIDLNNGGSDIVFNHNNFFQSQYIVKVHNAIERFAFTNNITQNKGTGIISSSLSGDRLIDNYFPGGIYAKNILAGGKASTYEIYTDNFYNPPATLNDVGFVDYSGGNYRLAATSPYKNAGTDGEDIGANIDIIETATAKTITGK